MRRSKSKAILFDGDQSVMEDMRRSRAILRHRQGLSVLLLFLSTAKLTLGADLISSASLTVVCLFEALIGVTLLTSLWRVALWATLALAVGFVVIGLAAGDQPCGCLGRLYELSQAQRLVAAGLLGGWSSYALAMRFRQSTPRHNLA